MVLTMFSDMVFMTGKAGPVKACPAFLSKKEDYLMSAQVVMVPSLL